MTRSPPGSVDYPPTHTHTQGCQSLDLGEMKGWERKPGSAARTNGSLSEMLGVCPQTSTVFKLR